ncbi:polysaccharide biosynthesis protein [Cupriavidus basilensis]
MVRFGNVLGSSGSGWCPCSCCCFGKGARSPSRIPTLSASFMLIPEAAQLVIQAGAMAREERSSFLTWASLSGSSTSHAR